MIKAVYPGTFDPLTRGHEDLVRRAARLYDPLILGVADSRAKRTYFTLQERVAMAREVLGDLKNVEVVGFDALLIDFVRSHNGCHVAEVEIDPETGECEIVSYVACDDVGNIINHQIVEGQMQGGVTQGAGHIFLEQGVYDASGQLLTGSFMDYAMPRAGLVGGLTVTDHAVPTATNPLGAKGVGEGGVTGSMPALMNAVLDALRGAGVNHFDMPATPQRVWSALQSAKR